MEGIRGNTRRRRGKRIRKTLRLLENEKEWKE